MILAAAAVLALCVPAEAGFSAPAAPEAPDTDDALATARDTVRVGRETALEARDAALGPEGPQPTGPVDPDDAPAPLDDAKDDLVAKAKPVLDAVPDDPLAAATELATTTAKDAGRTVRQTLEPILAPAPTEPAPDAEPQSATSETVLTMHPVLAGGLLLASAVGAAAIGVWLAGSSSVGAGAAAATGAAKSTELRRLLPFASPMFTRFERDTVLGHPRREALYALILQQPGISLQALGDAAGLSRTAVLHHLRLMELQHLVVSKRVGRSRHYYENGGRYGRDQKEAYAVLQNERTRQVADFIKAHPGTMQKSVCEALAIQPSIAHWHVKRLQEAQLVEAVRKGRTVAYFPGRTLAPAPDMGAPAMAAPSGALPA